MITKSLKRIAVILVFTTAATAVPARLSTCVEESGAAELEEFDFANGLFSRGMYDMAVDGYKDFLKKYPGSRYAELANFRIAECYFLSEKYDEALNRFGAFLKQYPSGDLSLRAELRKGQAYYMKGEHRIAEKIFSELAARDDAGEAKAPAVYYLAGVHFRRGEYEKARDILVKLLADGGDGEYAAFAYMNLGDIYLELEQPDKAAEAYTKAKEHAPDKGLAEQAAFRAGNAYYMAGDGRKARESYSGALEGEGGTRAFDSAALGVCSTLYKEGDYKAVIRRAQELLPRVKEREVRSQILFMLGNGYFHSDDLANALKIFSETSREYGDTEYGRKALLNECWTLYRLGDFKECLSNVERYLRAAKEDLDEAMYLKAKALAETGKTAESLELYRKMVETFKGSPLHREALYELGWLQESSGNEAEAAGYFQMFIETYPRDERSPALLLKTAQANLELKRYEDAEKEYREFLERFPDDPLKENVLFQLGRAYLEQDNYDRAIETFEVFLKEYPSSRAADAAVYWMGRGYQRKNLWDKAIESYSRLIPDKKGEFYGLAMESMAYSNFEKGDHERAAGLYYALMTGSPAAALHEGVYRWVAEYYLTEGQNDRSLAVLGAMEKEHADTMPAEEVAYMYGENYRGVGDLARAEEYLKKAVSGEVGSPYLERAHLGLGRTYSAMGDHEKAMDHLNEALRVHKDNLTGALARMEIGEINFRLMDFEEAGKQYMMVAILYDDEELSPRALYRAGSAFEKAGMPEKAVEVFGELINRYPGDPLARKAEEDIKRLGREEE